MAIQYSKSNPPLTFVPVNNNHLGARNELIPTEYTPSERLIKRVGHRIIHEHVTQFPDPNLPCETPLHPPYEARPTASSIIQGQQYSVASFPVQY